MATDKKLRELVGVDQPLQIVFGELEFIYYLLPLKEMTLVGDVHIASSSTERDE
jgi:hypothetical protein